MRRACFSVAALLAVLLLVFGEALSQAPHAVISDGSGDVALTYLFWRSFGFGSMTAGHVPLWNPYLYGGTPFMANFQSALLYPPNWMYLMVRLPLALDADMIGHVLLAGCTMYCWASYQGLGALSSMVAGVVYMLGGPHLLHVEGGHLSNLAVMAWAPLVFLAVDMVVDGVSAPGLLLGACAVAMQILAGHPQYVYYTGLTAGLYALWSGRRASGVATVAAFGAWGAAMAAVQLLPGLMVAGEGVRKSLSIDMASSYFLPWENLATMITPYVFGNRVDHFYWGRNIYWETSLYLGPAALCLLALGGGNAVATDFVLARHAGGRARAGARHPDPALSLALPCAAGFWPVPRRQQVQFRFLAVRRLAGGVRLRTADLAAGSRRAAGRSLALCRVGAGRRHGAVGAGPGRAAAEPRRVGNHALRHQSIRRPAPHVRRHAAVRARCLESGAP
jgi:hypothetical protein